MKKTVITILLTSTMLISQGLLADEQEHGILTASPQQQAAAVGHFTRARGLLLSAIREFDAGSRIASPEVLVDVEAWRQSVSDRAEDLQIVIAPQPRISKDGIHYEENIKIFDNKR